MSYCTARRYSVMSWSLHILYFIVSSLEIYLTTLSPRHKIWNRNLSSFTQKEEKKIGSEIYVWKKNKSQIKYWKDYFTEKRGLWAWKLTIKRYCFGSWWIQFRIVSVFSFLSIWLEPFNCRANCLTRQRRLYLLSNQNFDVIAWMSCWSTD